jgi:hypothetical protein
MWRARWQSSHVWKITTKLLHTYLRPKALQIRLQHCKQGRSTANNRENRTLPLVECNTAGKPRGFRMKQCGAETFAKKSFSFFLKVAEKMEAPSNRRNVEKAFVVCAVE